MKRQTVKVSSRGQVTIPSEIRDDLDVSEGDELELIKKEQGAYVLKRKEPIEDVSRQLRKEAEEKGYTREDLENRIDEVREELTNRLYGELDLEEEEGEDS